MWLRGNAPDFKVSIRSIAGRLENLDSQNEYDIWIRIICVSNIH